MGSIGKRQPHFGSDIAMTTTSPDPLPVTQRVVEIQSPQPPKEVEASRKRGRRKATTVSWYGRLLIISTLLVAAGWELFQWIITIITLD